MCIGTQVTNKTKQDKIKKKEKKERNKKRKLLRATQKSPAKLHVLSLWLGTLVLSYTNCINILSLPHHIHRRKLTGGSCDNLSIVQKIQLTIPKRNRWCVWKPRRHRDYPEKGGQGARQLIHAGQRLTGSYFNPPQEVG